MYEHAMKRRISTSGNSAALVLSQDVLGLMGIAAGDEVDITLVDRTLVVRPVAEPERERRVAEAMDLVFSKRRNLLRRLGEGPKPPGETPVKNPKRK
jgi:antitoxin component of MazEF toxin-antitoxin module